MKILTVTFSVSRKAGGIFAVIQRLNQSLALSADIQVSVIGLSDEFTCADSDSWQPLIAKNFPVKGPKAFGFSPSMNQHLLQSDCDIVHQHGIWQAVSIGVSRWHRVKQRPYLISPHGMLDSWALAHSRWKKQIAALCYENRNLRQATCLHALCKAEAEAMRAYGLKNPICIIPNGVDLPRMRNEDLERHRTSSHILHFRSSQRKVLLYLGRLHPKKGLSNLLRAWAQVRNDHEWILAIAGWDQGGHEADLKSLASELGLLWTESGSHLGEIKSQVSVLFLGPQFNQAQAACYQNCDAFILPSFSEGLPMTILEAWSYAKPVLMTPECNLPAGFTVEAALSIEPTTDSIAHGLKVLFSLSDSDLCAMGNNGLEFVSTHFTWPKVAFEMRSTYEWILGDGPKPDCVFQ